MPGVNWSEIHAKLPIAQTPEDKHKRAAIFDGFDPNGNGYLSLAELDKGIRDILGLESVYDCKPAIMRAYQAAKNHGKKHGKFAEDYVEKSEFRIFLVFLTQYFELYALFEELDTGDDHRISKDEFAKAINHMQSWGVTIADPDAEFAKIDTNGGGQILFDEFAAWALSHHLHVEHD